MPARSQQLAGQRCRMLGLRQEVYRVPEQGYPGWRFGLDLESGLDSYLYDVPGFGEREQGETWLVAPGAHAEAGLAFGRLALTPGLRADLLAYEEGVIPVLDPRLSVRHQLRERFALKATAGQHSQFPETRQLLSEGDGNPELEASHALQTSLGAEQELGPWTIGVTGFWHELYDLVSGREDAFAFFSGPPATGPFDTDPYANDGTGRVVGVESLVRLDADRTIALVSATVSRSTRVDRPAGTEELFRYDQPLVLNALVSHELNERWRFGARARLSSGYAYTPVDSRWVDLGSQTFVPVYGDADSERLPPFFSLDIRVDRTWTFRAWELTAYLDVQNATNATNPEVMSWSYDFSEEEPVQSTPILPAFGVRAGW